MGSEMCIRDSTSDNPAPGSTSVTPAPARSSSTNTATWPSRLRLRVGYVSSDFANHPLSHLMQSVFRFHARTSIEVFCYSLRPSDGSKYRCSIEDAAEHFREVRRKHSSLVLSITASWCHPSEVRLLALTARVGPTLIVRSRGLNHVHSPFALRLFLASQVSHQDSVSIARLIATDQIQVLVNLNGYTKGARNEIFALRPAPIQVLYMGFPGSMGADFIDYVVSDRVTSPAELVHLYHEKLLWMPNSYFVNDHKQAFNGPHCGIIPPEAISPFWADPNFAIDASAKAADATLLVRGNAAGLAEDLAMLGLDSSDGPEPCSNQSSPHLRLSSLEYFQSVGLSHTLALREKLRHKYGLPPFAMIYCCFNQLYKLDPRTFLAWCTILSRVFSPSPFPSPACACSFRTCN